MKLKLLMTITIAVILICVVPVSAMNVTYPQEYYTLGSLVDNYFSNQYVNNKFGYSLDWIDNLGGFASLASARELRRQTILMEKQNELQAELVKAQWVETCYAPKTSYGAGGRSNETAWKSECANAGHPVG